MRIADLSPAPGSRKSKHRVGRGTGGKGGKTAGRGTKGQGARGSIKPGFEGGQLPLKQRIPKLRGFNNPFRVEYAAVNLSSLAELSETDIDIAVLYSHGLVPKKALVKVLANGEITKALNVSAHAFSKSAEAAITGAGGTVTRVEKPHGDRRVPSQGSSHTNR